MTRTIFILIGLLFSAHSMGSVLHKGFYVGAQLNEQRSHSPYIYDTNQNMALIAGFNIDAHLSVEAGYQSIPVYIDGGRGDTRLLSIAPMFNFPMNRHVAFYGKAGIASMVRDIHRSHDYDHQHGIGFIAEAGLKASISQMVTLRFGYHYLRSSYNHYRYTLNTPTERSGLTMGLQVNF